MEKNNCCSKLNNKKYCVEHLWKIYVRWNKMDHILLPNNFSLMFRNCESFNEVTVKPYLKNLKYYQKFFELNPE